MALESVSNPSPIENGNVFRQPQIDITPNQDAETFSQNVWREREISTIGTGDNTTNNLRLAMAPGGAMSNFGEVLQLTDKGENDLVHLALSGSNLVSAIKASVDRYDLGNRVPSDARRFANYKVPENLQCASSMSDILIDEGYMNSRDYKIRVRDLNKDLARLFPSQRLRGKFDLNDFPPGSKGFISGLGRRNHVGYFERVGDSVVIIHNKNGKIVQENIDDKFYSSSGNPRYADMRIFRIQ